MFEITVLRSKGAGLLSQLGVLSNMLSYDLAPPSKVANCSINTQTLILCKRVVLAVVVGGGGFMNCMGS